MKIKQHYFMKKVKIKPFDILFFKDSRPMGGSFRGHGENFPLPHTFNGALRAAAIQKNKTAFFTAGPFLEKSNKVFFPTPSDLILNGEAPKVKTMSPLAGSYCTNLPAGIRPIGAGRIVETKEKLGNFLSKEDYEAYLRGEPMAPASFKTNSDFYAVENNFGISIDKETNLAIDKKFFTKNTIRLRDGVSFVGIMRDSAGYPQRTCVKFGGESRYSDCIVGDLSSQMLPVPPRISGKRVKFVLLTPAIFAPQQDHPGAWLPNWVRHDNYTISILDGPGAAKARRMRAKGLKIEEGSPIKAKLVGAKIERPVPISGIASGEGMRKAFGEKAVLLAVPAGSVYYFEADDEIEAQKLAKILNWNGGDPDCFDIKNARSMLLGEKGYGIGVCAAWEYSNLE